MRELASLVNGIFYAPVDYVSCIRRSISAVRPALLVILETEIWPNLYVEAKRAGCGLAVVNGRISSRTWPRYKRFRAFFRPVLCLVDLLLVQSQSDFERYRLLGAKPSRLSIEGNLKFDASVASGSPPFGNFGASQVWIAASTVGPNERGSLQSHDVDEDDLVIEAFRELQADFPKLLLILAPRQPARFEKVLEKLKSSGLAFVRRTELYVTPEKQLTRPGILLLDTIGELSRVYQLADVVFVGGSLAPRGGHNIIEPGALGLPVIVGPHMQNFETIAQDFLARGAIIQIANAEDLAPTVRRLLVDANEARAVGTRARNLVEIRRGASVRISEKLAALYFVSQYTPPHNFFVHFFLKGLAFLWREGGKAKRRRSEQQANLFEPLAVPVISIGAITMGGSGKTPFTVYLSSQLKARGYAPAILTRGYRRRSPSANLVLPSGTRANAAFTGDEAQIFLRADVGPVGIGSNRYQTARILLAHIPETGVLVLDDGFQHAQLPRNIDVVIIDGLDPFGQYGVFPLGRLREPLSALTRADVLLISRAESALQFETIAERLRSYNSFAPIFRTRLVTKTWRDARTGKCLEQLSSRRVAAFCGLGNPANFFNTLESLGLEVVFRWSFGDHYSYRPLDIARVVHQARLNGADILVTTEKDTANFPLDTDSVLQGFDIAWLEVEMQVEDPSTFFATIDHLLRQHRPSPSRPASAPR